MTPMLCAKDGSPSSSSTPCLPWSPPLVSAYRLGDLVNGQLFLDHIHHPNDQPHPWELCRLHPNSLACEYVRQTNGSRTQLQQRGTPPGYQTFCAILWRRLARIKPDEFDGRRFAAIHLRLGDVFEEPYYHGMGCVLPKLETKSCRYAFNPSYYRTVPLPNVEHCVLIGDPTFRNRLGTNLSLEYVNRVEQELSKRGCVVHRRFGRSADEDLSLFASARVFVPVRGSGFSHLALKCREPRYHELNPQLVWPRPSTLCESRTVRVVVRAEHKENRTKLVAVRSMQFVGVHADGQNLTKPTSPFKFNEARVQCEVPDGPLPECSASTQPVESASDCSPCPCKPVYPPDWSGGFSFLLRMATVLLDGRCEPSSSSAPFRLLVIGLGGGTLATYAQQRCGAVVDVIEGQPDVLHAAERFFGFQRSGRVLVRDGLEGLRELASASSGKRVYDGIMIDCMIHGEIPPSSKSKEFVVSLLDNLLKRKGALAQYAWGRDLELLVREYGARFESVQQLFRLTNGSGIGVVEVAGPRASGGWLGWG